jgi:formiminotetrahydrofolate cyclodeaminase
MNLIDLSLRNLLAEFSSPDPTPGGGSASALASAVGASLLMMVAALPKTRTGAEEERAALTAAAGALGEIRRQLGDAIDADAAAYDEVVAAYKLPKASPEEQSARKATIQLALRVATDVPLGVMRSSASALSHAKTIAANGNRNAASDVGVATALLRAGLRGAGLNVATNLGSISDAAYRGAIDAETVQLSGQAAHAPDEAEALLRIA